jgi:hypothetical protein
VFKGTNTVLTWISVTANSPRKNSESEDKSTFKTSTETHKSENNIKIVQSFTANYSTSYTKQQNTQEEIQVFSLSEVLFDLLLKLN